MGLTKEQKLSQFTDAELGMELERRGVTSLHIPDGWECEINRCSDTGGFECDYVDGPVIILVVE